MLLSTTKRLRVPLQLVWLLLLAVIVVIINCVLFLVGSHFGIIDNTVTKELSGIQQSITLAPVIKATLFGFLFGSLILFMLSFFVNKIVANLLVIIMIIVSFLLPFLVFTNIPVGMGIWLNLMYITVGLSFLLLSNYIFLNRKI